MSSGKWLLTILLACWTDLSHDEFQGRTPLGESREDRGKRLRTSGKWISTVTRVYFTMLEYIVHVLRLYKACDASKIMAIKLCGSPFLLRLEIRAFDYVRLVLCNEPTGMGL